MKNYFLLLCFFAVANYSFAINLETNSIGQDSIPHYIESKFHHEYLLLDNIKSLIDSNQIEQARLNINEVEEGIKSLSNKDHILWGIYYMQLSTLNIKAGEYLKGDKNSSKAIEVLSQLDTLKPIWLIHAFQNRSNAQFWLGDLEKSKIAQLNSLDIIEANSASLGHLKPLSLISLGAIVKDLGEIQQAFKYFDMAEDLISDNDNLLSSIYNHKAVIFEQNENLRKGLEFHQKTLKIRLNLFGNESMMVAQSYNNIGVNYMYQHSLYKAILYFEKTLKLFENLLPEDHYYFSIPLRNKAYCQKHLGDYAGSIKTNNESLRIQIAKSGEKTTEAAKSYITLSSSYLSLKKYREAKEYAYKAKDIILKFENPTPNNLKLLYGALGEIHLSYKEYNKAIEYFKESLALDEYSPFYLSKNFSLANAYFKNGNYQEALEIIQSFEYSYNIESENFDDSNALFYAYLLAFKKEIIYKQKILDEEILIAELISISKIQTNLINVSNENRSSIGAVKFNDYSGYICEVDLKLSSKINNIELQNHCFKNLQNYKASSLKSMVNKANALEFSNIPDSLLTLEYDLKSSLNLLENKLQSEKNDSTRNTYLNEIKDLKFEYDNLLDKLSRDFSDYHNLVYDKNTTSIKTVQESLIASDQALIEYIVTDSSIYTFTILTDTFFIDQIKKDFPLEEWVENMLSGIQSTVSISEKPQNNYYDAAYALYEKILAPIDIKLPENTKLIIIPDGILGYIPFEALYTQDPEDVQQLDKMKYLIHQHEISYAYSSTLQEEMQNRKHNTIPNNNLLAFAPSFQGDTSLLASRNIDLSNDRNNLAPLKHNQEEVQYISSLVAGDIYLDSMATKAKFKELSGDYKIIHLSTHGKANDKVGDYSFLAFYETQDSIENEWLYNRELYNLELNADMVVLSACETGIGELQKGEGIISLARGFSYAGAKSIITSLWNVNDLSTKVIMEYFYENIKSGMTKSTALRSAKLSYIENHPNLGASPYYWAAFIPIGDMSPIELNSQNDWALYLAGTVLTFLMLFLFFKYRSS